MLSLTEHGAKHVPGGALAVFAIAALFSRVPCRHVLRAIGRSCGRSAQQRRFRWLPLTRPPTSWSIASTRSLGSRRICVRHIECGQLTSAAAEQPRRALKCARIFARLRRMIVPLSRRSVLACFLYRAARCERRASAGMAAEPACSTLAATISVILEAVNETQDFWSSSALGAAK